MPSRSAIHMLIVAAERTEQSGGSPDLVQSLRKAADWRAVLRAEGRDWKARAEVETKRAEKQRTLFAMLPSCNATDRLKVAMMQRAYDVLWDGDATACDALLEFIPSKEADALMDSWSRDWESDAPKSQWYGGQR